MLTIGTMPILLKIVSKLDVKPIIEVLKGVDIFTDAETREDAAKQLSRENLGLLAMEVVSEITPQLGRIADDLPVLVAAYKGVSYEEAVKLDAADVIDELIHDEGITTFFTRALRKKAAQGA